MLSDIFTLRALGCSFMATDTVRAGRALKMQEGWASVVTDHCYFTVELKWRMDPFCVCSCQDNGASNNVGTIHLNIFLSCFKLHKQTTYHNLVGTFTYHCLTSHHFPYGWLILHRACTAGHWLDLKAERCCEELFVCLCAGDSCHIPAKCSD